MLTQSIIKKCFPNAHKDCEFIIRRRNGKTYIKKTKKEEEAKQYKVVSTSKKICKLY